MKTVPSPEDFEHEDEMVRRRRAVLAKMASRPPEEMFAFLVKIGIYTEDGKLTPEYGGVV